MALEQAVKLDPHNTETVGGPAQPRVAVWVVRLLIMQLNEIMATS